MRGLYYHLYARTRKPPSSGRAISCSSDLHVEYYASYFRETCTLVDFIHHTHSRPTLIDIYLRLQETEPSVDVTFLHSHNTTLLHSYTSFLFYHTFVYQLNDICYCRVAGHRQAGYLANLDSRYKPSIISRLTTSVLRERVSPTECPRISYKGKNGMGKSPAASDAAVWV